MMEILRSIGAVVAGYAIMVILVMASFAVAGSLFKMRVRTPGGDAPAPTPSYLAYNLSSGLVAAVAGGWVTGCIAKHNLLWHAGALALLIAAMGVVSARRPQPGQPSWYPLTITAIGVAGALAGGWLCMQGF
jgi:hypothetical protein